MMRDVFFSLSYKSEGRSDRLIGESIKGLPNFQANPWRRRSPKSRSWIAGKDMKSGEFLFNYCSAWSGVACTLQLGVEVCLCHN